jgi:hypothetical protein
VGTENRKFNRRSIDLVVYIDTFDGPPVRGELLDLSQGGVRLKVSDPNSLPDQFMLILSDKLRRWSRIAWRSTDEIGVEFVSAPQRPAEDNKRRSLVIKCPRTGRNISTGIRLTATDDLSKLSGVRRFTQCPSCKAVHGWTPSEALLTD